MNLIFNAFKYSLSFFGNPLLLSILLVAGIIFYKRNMKIVKQQEYIIGEKVNSVDELTFSQLTVGLIMGIIASILFFIIGIILDSKISIEVILLTSFFLMFYRTRMVCFSYSGALLGFISLISTYISNELNVKNILSINIMSLILFVALMHFFEAILVIIDGYRGAIPIFKIKNGKIIGGFSLNRNWLMPVISFYAMVGYSASTFTLSKKNKAKESGVIIGIYAIILIVIAQICKFGIGFEILALLLMPITHEVMSRYQLYRENSREYKYVSDNGISVLEILPQSPFNKIGVKSGDKIVSINGLRVKEERDILRIRNEYYGTITVELEKENGKKEIHDISLKKDKQLHMILVPKNNIDLVNTNNLKFEEVLKSLKDEIDLKNSMDKCGLEIREKEIDNLE